MLAHHLARLDRHGDDVLFEHAKGVVARRFIRASFLQQHAAFTAHSGQILAQRRAHSARALELLDEHFFDARGQSGLGQIAAEDDLVGEDLAQLALRPP